MTLCIISKLHNGGGGSLNNNCIYCTNPNGRRFDLTCLRSSALTECRSHLRR